MNGVQVENAYTGKGQLELAKLGEEANQPGTLARSLLTTGLPNLPETGIYSIPKNLPPKTLIVARSHEDHPSMLAWEGTDAYGRIFLSWFEFFFSFFLFLFLFNSINNK